MADVVPASPSSKLTRAGRSRKQKRVFYGMHIVIKNNDLVRAVRQPESKMGVIEYKVLLTIIARLPRDIDIGSIPDGQAVIINVPRVDIAKALGDDGNLVGKQLEVVLETIYNDKVRVLYPDGKIRLTGWASAIEYHPDKGDIRFEIDPGMLPFLVADTVLGFTKFGVPEIAHMRSLRSILLYEHVALNEHIGIWEPSIDELRLILDAPAASYPTTGALYKYVISHAVNEINSTSAARLMIRNHAYIKQVRKAVALRFEISPKSHDRPVSIPYEVLVVIPPRLRKDERFLGTIKYEIAFNKSGRNYSTEQLRRVVLYTLGYSEGKDDMARWLRYCLDDGLGADSDIEGAEYYPNSGRSTKYRGPANDIRVTWTNVPDEQNQEMWTGKNGELDIGSMILPPEKVKELLETDQLVRLYL